jgi:hypothetical protein
MLAILLQKSLSDGSRLAGKKKAAKNLQFELGSLSSTDKKKI